MTDHDQPAAREVLSPETRAELRLSYEDALNNIRWAKQQQWQTAYYILLVDAAIVGFSVYAKDTDAGQIWGVNALSAVLVILAIVVALAGTWLLCSQQRFIVQERKRLHRIRDRHFSQEFHETIFNKPDHTHFMRHSDVLVIFVTASVLGADFAILVLLESWFALLLATLGMVITCLIIAYFWATKSWPDWTRGPSDSA